MSIKAKIEIDNSELKQGFKQAENTAKSSMKNIKSTAEGAGGTMDKIAKGAQSASNAMKGGFSGVVSLLGKLGPVGAVVAASITVIGAAAIGTVNLVNKLATKLNDIGKAAKSVNMTANQYLALQYASARAGVEMNDVLSLITKIDQAMIKASEGEAKYRDAFYALGLTWRDLSRLSPEKQIIAMAEAIAKLRSEGRNVPSEIFDVFNRKDIRNLNKLSNEDVGRLVAEAGALGYDIDEDTIRAAEELQDVYGDINQKVVAWAANLKEAKAAMKELAELTKKASKNIGTGDGSIKPEYSDRYIGIKEVGEQLIKSGKLSEDDKREVIYGVRRQIGTSTSETPRELSRLSGDALEKEYEKSIKQINWKNLGKALSQSIFKVVERNDSRFKADSIWAAKRNDANSYVKTKEDIAADKVRDRAEDTNRELLKQVQYYDSITNKIGIEFDVERKILDLEKELSTVTRGKENKLDESVKLSMRQNTALMKQKAIEVELKKLNDAKKKSYNKSYIDILSDVGGNQSALSLLNDSLESIGKKGIGKTFETDLETRLLQKYLLAGNKPPLELSLSDMLDYDPKMFYESLKETADAFNTNFNVDVISNDVTDKLNEAQDAYNEFASRLKLEPLSIDLTSDDFGVQKEQIDAAINAMRDYEKNIDLIKQKEEQIAKLNKENPNGDSLRKSNLAGEIASLRYPLQILQSLKDAKNSVGEIELSKTIAQNNAALQLQNRMKKSTVFMSSAESDLEEARLIKAQLEGNQQKTEELRRQNILKKAGIIATKENLVLYEKELNAIIEAEGQLSNEKIKKSMIDQAESARLALLEKSGKGREASFERMLKQMKEINGENPLNDDQITQIRRLSNLMYDIQNISLPSRSEDVIHTNELASKGGFASSVVIERRDNSERILNIINKINEREEDIRVIIRDIHNNKL